MSQARPRFHEYVRPAGAGDPNGFAASRPPDFKPCWRCHWFHHHEPRHFDGSACLNPRCSQLRSSPASGCCCWELDPARANDTKPVDEPSPEIRAHFRRWRGGLERVFERANGSMQPWEARRYVLNREGELEPPVTGSRQPCMCHLPAVYRDQVDEEPPDRDSEKPTTI